MKKLFVAFGVAVAIIGCVLFCSTANWMDGEDPMRDRNYVEANLADATEAYLLNVSMYDHGINDITIMDRYYDAYYDGEVADVMITRTDGFCDFAKIRVSSIVDWYTQNA